MVPTRRTTYSEVGWLMIYGGIGLQFAALGVMSIGCFGPLVNWQLIGATILAVIGFLVVVAAIVRYELEMER